MLTRQTKNWMLLATAMLLIAPAHADTEAVTINYGTVESVTTVEKDSKHAGGRDAWRVDRATQAQRTSRSSGGSGRCSRAGGGNQRHAAVVLG
jgi:hypothetical protein